MSVKVKGGTELDVQAVLPVNAYAYYIERDSAAFRALLSKSLKLGNLRFRDSWQDHGCTFVRLVTKPEVSSWIPSAVRNAVANASEVEFHDIIEYNPKLTSGPSYTLHIRTESPFLGDKLDVQTTLTLTPVSENETIQRLHGRVRVRMLGMGGFIERAICDNLVKTYSKLPEIVARWEAYKAEAMTYQGNAAQVLLAGRPPVGGDLEYVRTIMKAPVLDGKLSGDFLGAEEPIFYDASEEFFAEDEEAVLQGQFMAAGVASAMDLDKDYLQEQHQQQREIEIEKQRVLWNVPASRGATHPPPATAPRHVRRRTADELILDALPPLGPEVEMHPAVARHWRRSSVESVGSEGSEAPTDLEMRAPGSRGAHTAWRQFNRSVAAWEHYWGLEVGVRAAAAAQQGVLRILIVLWTEIVDIIRLVAIVLLLGLLRVGLLKVTPATLRGPRLAPHRRTLSAPPETLVAAAAVAPAAEVGTGAPSPETMPNAPSGRTHPYSLSMPKERKKSRFVEEVERNSIDNAHMRLSEWPPPPGRLPEGRCSQGAGGGSGVVGGNAPLSLAAEGENRASFDAMATSILKVSPAPATVAGAVAAAQPLSAAVVEAERQSSAATDASGISTEYQTWTWF